MMRQFENHVQWSAVKEVCEKLIGSGYQALLAGGCVRDLIMNREPNDFDIATNANPDQVAALFTNSIPVGRAFGVIIVAFPGFNIEVATFREDLEYIDGRRPEGIKFSTPEADAKRRDFTINALFFDLNSQKILDFVGGEKDIAARIIRTVGAPEQRFNEDKLRLMRAVRFSAQLDFQIAPETWDAVKVHASEITVVSRERIKDELLKLLKSDARMRGVRLLWESGLLQAIAPELFGSLDDESRERWVQLFSFQFSESPSLVVWLSAFLLPIALKDGVEKARAVLRSLKLDNRQIESCAFCLKNLAKIMAPQAMRRGEWVELLLQEEMSDELIQLAEVVASQAKPLLVSEENWKTAVQSTRTRIKSGIIQSSVILNGRDLTEAGVKPGPQMGKIMRELHLMQLEEKINSRNEALDHLKELVKTT